MRTKTKCPLGICDGSGFIPLDEDEDNCPHVDDRPPGDWTPKLVKDYLWHYGTAHRFGDSACPWCAPKIADANDE